MNQDVALENLSTICEVLKSCKVKHWITDGSLLGLVRENKLIDHDTDTDIGLFIQNFDRGVLELLTRRGFSVEHTFGDPSSSLEIALTRNGVKTDLFFFYRVWIHDGVVPKIRFRHSAFHDFKEGTYRRIDYFYKPFCVAQRDFIVGRFPVPRSSERFLLQKYGRTWRTPVTTWDYAFDPANAKPTDLVLNAKEQDFLIHEFLEDLLVRGS